MGDESMEALQIVHGFETSLQNLREGAAELRRAAAQHGGNGPNSAIIDHLQLGRALIAEMRGILENLRCKVPPMHLSSLKEFENLLSRAEYDLASLGHEQEAQSQDCVDIDSRRGSVLK